MNLSKKEENRYSLKELRTFWNLKLSDEEVWKRMEHCVKGKDTQHSESNSISVM